MYIYCIHLFVIPSQSVFGRSFAKPLAKAFRKTSIVVQRLNSISFVLRQPLFTTRKQAVAVVNIPDLKNQNKKKQKKKKVRHGN